VSRYWIVICPELYAVGIVASLHEQNCVAAGWPPTSTLSKDQLMIPAGSTRGTVCGKCASAIRSSLLTKMEDRPVGTIRSNIKDEQWNLRWAWANTPLIQLRRN